MDASPVAIRELRRDGVELHAFGGQFAALHLAAAALGLALPAINRTSQAGDLTIIGVAPQGWLILAPQGDPCALAARLAPLAAHGALVETGHGVAFIEIAGGNARHVLAKGCRIDLHDRAFRAGDAARTVMAQIGVTLWRPDDRPAYNLAFPATFAASFSHFLLASAEETGADILPPRED
jgi:sarcosine oxidase subunit gamma